jgi:hypothetical protein
LSRRIGEFFQAQSRIFAFHSLFFLGLFYLTILNIGLYIRLLYNPKFFRKERNMNNKRIVLALIGLALLLVLVYVVVQSQQAKKAAEPAEAPVPVTHFESILIGKGSSPKWSPDGTKIAYISEDGWLTIIDADGKGESKKVAPAKFGSFYWLDSVTFITTSSDYKEQNGKKVAQIWRMKTLTADGKEELIKEDIVPYR